jgi:hypothetical protein
MSSISPPPPPHPLFPPREILDLQNKRADKLAALEDTNTQKKTSEKKDTLTLRNMLCNRLSVHRSQRLPAKKKPFPKA